jgi:hypothetical protein
MEQYEARVLRDGLAFGEGPRWHDGRLWFSDFYRHAIFSIDEDGTEERLEHAAPTQPSGLGWLPDGDLLFVSMTDQRVLRVHEGTTSLFADVAPYCGFWANEMITSGTGVSYVGSFGFDLDVFLRDVGAEALLADPPTTNLVVLGPEGDVRPSSTRLGLSQWHRDHALTGRPSIIGETMIVSRLSAFDIATDGTLSNRRVWAPDGVRLRPTVCASTQRVRSGSPTRIAPQCLRVREGGEVTGVVTNNSERLRLHRWAARCASPRSTSCAPRRVSASQIADQPPRPRLKWPR